MTVQLSIFGGAPEPVRCFEQDAYGFLIAYAARNRGQAFSSEDVTLAALEAGLQPVDLRRWGSIFSQAAREGHIRRSEVLFPRSMGNGSLAPGWVAA
jgi:hypothetical protein